MNLAELTAAVRGLLTSRGPLTSDEIVDRLSEVEGGLGGDLAVHVLDVLVQDDVAFIAVPEDRWAWAPALLDRRIFTHRLTHSESTNDYIAISADLLAFYPLTLLAGYKYRDSLSPTSATPCELLEAGPLFDTLRERNVPDLLVTSSAVVFAPGRFAEAGLIAGDVILVEALGRNLECRKSDSVTPPPPSHSSAIAEWVLQAPEPQELFELAWRNCALDDTAFRAPIVPLSELAIEAGLELSPLNETQVAHPGFDWKRWLQRGFGDPDAAMSDDLAS